MERIICSTPAVLGWRRGGNLVATPLPEAAIDAGAIVSQPTEAAVRLKAAADLRGASPQCSLRVVGLAERQRRQPTPRGPLAQDQIGRSGQVFRLRHW